MIQITVHVISVDVFLPLRLDANESIENVKALIEAELQLPMAEIQIRFGDKILNNQTTLEQAGVKNADLIMAFLLEKRQKTKQAEVREDMDPFDVEAQRKIEEGIRMSNVEENRIQAMEEHPESFFRVSMLYVNAKINNMLDIAAFIDSGAQTTIISKSVASKCGLLRFLDERFAGMAKGVGVSKILGKIHSAPLRLGNTHFDCSFTVLENEDMPFLFGLDNLRKFQACIDLKKNVLSIGSEDIPFLSDSESSNLLTILDNVSDSKGPASSINSPAAVISPPTSATVPAVASSGTSRANANSLNDAKENSIRQLMNLGTGFTRGQVIEALRLGNGNPDSAASILLFGG